LAALIVEWETGMVEQAVSPEIRSNKKKVLKRNVFERIVYDVSFFFGLIIGK